MHTAQLDYQTTDKTEASWMSTYFAQVFMYEKTPSLTGSGTQFYVLKWSVHTSSQKWNQNWILKLYFPLHMESCATSRNNLNNTHECWRFSSEKRFKFYVKGLPHLKSSVSYLVCVWLWRCSFAAALKNVYAETEGDWLGVEVSEGYF